MLYLTIFRASLGFFCYRFAKVSHQHWQLTSVLFSVSILRKWSSILLLWAVGIFSVKGVPALQLLYSFLKT